MADRIPSVLQVMTVTAKDVENRVPSAVALVDESGSPVTLGGTPSAGSVTNDMLAGGIAKDKLAPGVIPGVATATAPGIVRMAAATATVTAADPAAAAGAAPTKAEFDAVVTLAKELKAKLNSVIASARAAGQAAAN